MGVATHTPGPWWLADGNSPGFKTASGYESVLAQARPTDDFIVLKVAELCTNVSAAERKANARLIVAAPDLLEALEEMLDVAELYVPPPVQARRFKRARAALAKARGR